MTKRTPVLLGAVTLTLAPAAAQDQLWIRQFGTSDEDLPRALASDGTGGTFIAGQTDGSLVGLNAGGYDAWLARYDAAGTVTVIRQFGTPGFDNLSALAPDSAGGVFAAGSTDGAIGVPAGFFDAWLARFDGAGNLVWSPRQFGTSGGDWATALAPDGAGGVFIAGDTQGNLFAPNGGGLEPRDAFVARYDSGGTQLWGRQFGTDTGESTFAVASDGAGGVFVAGRTFGDLFGGPGGGDAFLTRYDAAGTQLWGRQVGTTALDQALALAPDGVGGVFLAGETGGDLGGQNAGSADAWLARYDSTGAQTWMRQIGSPASDKATALAPDEPGGVFVAGETLGSLPGPYAGSIDNWLARYDGAGNQTWILQIGSASVEYSAGLASDGSGGVFIGGHTGGNLGAPNLGHRDAWLARYADACYPDCNADDSLTVADFGCFQTRFVLADPYADCNADGQHTVADFGCFQTKFVAGCP